MTTRPLEKLGVRMTAIALLQFYQLLGSLLRPNGGWFANYKHTHRMKRNTLLSLLLLAVPAFAVPDSDLKLSPVPDIPVGEYRIVGSRPDAGGCFEGICKIMQKKDGTHVLQRVVGGKTTESDIAIRRVIENVFQVVCNYSRDGVDYVAYYHYSLDGNNYARLTGTVVRKDGKTKKCGLEALFHGKD